MQAARQENALPPAAHLSWHAWPAGHRAPAARPPPTAAAPSPSPCPCLSCLHEPGQSELQHCTQTSSPGCMPSHLLGQRHHASARTILSSRAEKRLTLISNQRPEVHQTMTSQECVQVLKLSQRPHRSMYRRLTCTAQQACSRV